MNLSKIPGSQNNSISAAIMIQMTSRHLECTHFNSDYSRMPAVALHVQTTELMFVVAQFQSQICLRIKADLFFAGGIIVI